MAIKKISTNLWATKKTGNGVLRTQRLQTVLFLPSSPYSIPQETQGLVKVEIQPICMPSKQDFLPSRRHLPNIGIT